MIRYNRQEFAECLEKGFDWKTRCDRIGAAVEEILDDTPADKVLRAGALTSLILKAYDYKRDRQHPEFKVVSKVITSIGKLAEYKHHISIGKEIRCGNKADGTPRYARERLWRGAMHNVNVNAELPLPADLAPAEASAQPEHKSPEDYMAVALKSIEILREHGFTVIYPGETVQGVDNSNISKHPSPGATRVDCGQCGGSGKVYMKQEPT